VRIRSVQSEINPNIRCRETIAGENNETEQEECFSHDSQFAILCR
jgi:hypothetical protein